MKILNRFTGEVIKEVAGDSLSRASLYGADLYGADLSGVDLSHASLSHASLSHANLYGANLYGADLYGANLSGADLSGANLYGVDLSGVDLSHASLSGADLSRSNLYGANLSRADLYGANLYRANLSRANLSGTNLSGANLSEVTGLYQIVPEVGAFEGFKKLKGGIICHLRIPDKAGRVGGYIGRKCRAEFALVVSGEGESGRGGVYLKGKVIHPDQWDNDPRVECSHGIHFFLTRKEAAEY